MDEFNCTDIQTASWLRNEHTIRIIVYFSRDDHLLLIPTRKGSGQYLGFRRSDIKLFDQFFTSFVDLFMIQETTFSKRRSVMYSKGNIIGNSKRLNHCKF